MKTNLGGYKNQMPQKTNKPKGHTFSPSFDGGRPLQKTKSVINARPQSNLPPNMNTARGMELDMGNGHGQSKS